MGLYKRGSIWWMSFMHNGKQVRTSTETDNRKLAEKIYRKVVRDIVENRWIGKPVPERRTFRDMMEKYMREHSTVKKRSTARDEASLKHLLPFFGGYGVSDINPPLVSRYKVERLAMGAAPSTLNRELALMKHAFSLAVREWEWTPKNPLKQVSMEKEPPSKNRWLAVEEEQDLLAVSPEWLRKIVIFAVDTGCRRGEILSLSWKHVNMATRVVTIFGEKTGEWRGVPMTNRVYAMLAAKQVEENGRPQRDRIVFSHDDGKIINIHELRWAFETALAKAGITDFRFHDLRHTFATRLAQNGVDPFTTQRLLGHKSFTTTQRYAHHYTESLRRGIRSLESQALSPGSGDDAGGQKGTGDGITYVSHSGTKVLPFGRNDSVQSLAG